MISKAAEKEANRRADEVWEELHQKVCLDNKLRRDAFEFVKTARGAYQLAQALMMFARMEFSSGITLGRLNDHVVQALMLSSKCVLYQHFSINHRKYGLSKKAFKKSR